MVGGGARALNASREAARAVAETFRIPTPATRAAEIPAEAAVDVVLKNPLDNNRTLDARAAHGLGLMDAVAESDLLAEGLEHAAAVVSGALSPADGLKVIATRSKLMARLSGQGAMALLELDADAAEKLVAEHPDITVAVR